MSIIQQLRDKSAVLLTGLIALSLIGFLVQDAFIGRSSGLFAGETSSVGSINGTKIDRMQFNDRVRQIEESNRQQGMASNEVMTQNIIESIWNGYIQEELINEQTSKLGLAFTPKEMSELLFSEDAPAEFKQLFTNPNTGAFDVQAAKNWFNNVKKSKKQEEVKMVNDQLIEPLITRSLAEKYTSLLSMGAYVPKWMIEKMNADNSSVASLNYVVVPYTTISDSSIKVTDDEINKYISNHKEEFKQEKTRSIAFVSFDANPSAEDSAAVFNKLAQMKEEFKNSPDARAFVTRNGTGIPYFDGFALKNRLAMDAKDTLVSMPVGSVVGPYLDGGAYVIAKKLETRSVPDSVKVRHILVQVQDPRSGAITRPDSVAKKTADSLFAAIQAGANFGALAAQFSDDQGSKANGGEYNFSTVDLNLAKGFYDFIFYKPTGSKGVIKTEFGYHVMEVLNQKNFDEGYKVAYLSKRIESSEMTDNNASTAATQFAGNSRDLKAFDANVQKNNLNKRLADNIREMDYSVGDLANRQFVKWIYSSKVGTVSEPFDFKNKYVVAVVTGVYDEGVQSAKTARVMVEPILRNQKKAEQIKKKIGTANSLQAIANATGSSVGLVDTLRFGDAFIPNVGPEPKVIGASFNKANQGKVSAPVAGNSGVFTVQVNSVGAVSNLGIDPEGQRKAMVQQLRQYASYGAFESLKKAATIKDTRREAGF
jgi:peptidyl-prolyl cis-trans isomerase D